MTVPSQPSVQNKTSPATGHDILKGLPILWSHKRGGQAIGLHVDDREAWASWTNGDVVACDHAGAVLRRWRLPVGVDALVADEVWRYAGCRDGRVYDLTTPTPRVAYEVAKGSQIQGIDVYRGHLLASDDRGGCTVVDAEQNLLWKRTPRGRRSGWMVRGDASGVYRGNSAGIVRYDWQGTRQWRRPSGEVGYGVLASDRVYAIVAVRTPKVAVVALDRASGALVWRGRCWSTAKTYRLNNNAASCAASPDGGRVYGGTCDTLFCFDGEGALLWESPMRCGAPCSMALRGDRLYVATQRGEFACLDVSAAAVAAAKREAGARAPAQKLPNIPLTRRAIEETDRDDGGVVLECVRDGAQLRVRVRSAGYHADWYCQFPRDLRREGARFVADSIREATQGGFYRILGEIRRLRG